MIKIKKILFIDTETGGLDPKKHSLLSIGLVCWDNGKITKSKEIFIKENNYIVTPDALEINKINVSNLNEIGITKEEADFQIKHFISCNFGRKEIIIGGHNTHFDMNFLKENNLDNFKYNYRYIDTASILNFFYFLGLTKKNLSNLKIACEAFKINNENPHSALSDAIATAELFTELILFMKE